MSKKTARPLIDVLTEPPTFGPRLRQLRQSKGYSTVYAFCKAHKLDQTAVGRLENGQRQPSWEMVQRLALALGVGVEEFNKP